MMECLQPEPVCQKWWTYSLMQPLIESNRLTHSDFWPALTSFSPIIFSFQLISGMFGVQIWAIWSHDNVCGTFSGCSCWRISKHLLQTDSCYLPPGGIWREMFHGTHLNTQGHAFKPSVSAEHSVHELFQNLSNECERYKLWLHFTLTVYCCHRGGTVREL